jgi:hypothetical protein
VVTNKDVWQVFGLVNVHCAVFWWLYEHLHGHLAASVLSVLLLLQWANDHLLWNIRNWQKIHLSDESWFFLLPVDRRIRVWRQINTAYNENNIFPTSAFCSGGVTVWGCFSIAIHLSVHSAIENIKIQLASERKATPHSYTARTECTCWEDVVNPIEHDCVGLHWSKT